MERAHLEWFAFAFAPGFWFSVYDHFPVSVCSLTAALLSSRAHERREERGGETIFDKHEERGLVAW
jgi:hypothetical protein